MWARYINILVGLWLMAAPALLPYGDAATDNGHIIGPVLVTFATIALWEATRTVRLWNFPLGIWLLLAPWILGYTSTLAICSDMGAGILILLFCSIKGTVKKKYGGGWTALFKQNPEHMKTAQPPKKDT